MNLRGTGSSESGQGPSLHFFHGLLDGETFRRYDIQSDVATGGSSRDGVCQPYRPAATSGRLFCRRAPSRSSSGMSCDDLDQKYSRSSHIDICATLQAAPTYMVDNRGNTHNAAPDGGTLNKPITSPEMLMQFLDGQAESRARRGVPTV